VGSPHLRTAMDESMEESGFQRQHTYNEGLHLMDFQSADQETIPPNISASNDSNWPISTQYLPSLPNGALYSNPNMSNPVTPDITSTLLVLPMTTLNEPRATSATWDLDGSQQYLANDFSSSGCDVSDHRIDLLSEFKG